MKSSGLKPSGKPWRIKPDAKRLQPSWVPIDGYGGAYEVSDLGGVRRVGSSVENRPFVNRGGYLMYGLSQSSKVKKVPAHRLVLLAFVGPPADGCEACHNNGDRKDNRPENLRWDSRRANHADKALHGTEQTGERNGNAVLTAELVARGRAMVAAGTAKARVAAHLGVSPRTVHDFVTRRTWRHVA